MRSAAAWEGEELVPGDQQLRGKVRNCARRSATAREGKELGPGDQ
jgi:hypothetical protein